jgi:hypothetical protein
MAASTPCRSRSLYVVLICALICAHVCVLTCVLLYDDGCLYAIPRQVLMCCPYMCAYMCASHTTHAYCCQRPTTTLSVLLLQCVFLNRMCSLLLPHHTCILLPTPHYDTPTPHYNTTTGPQSAQDFARPRQGGMRGRERERERERDFIRKQCPWKRCIYNFTNGMQHVADT